MGVAWRILGVALGFTFAWPARAQFSVPDAPIDVALDVLSGSDVQITFEAPLTDGGAAVQAYNIEWDTDPGEQEIQTVTTTTYIGANEVQTLTSTAFDEDEVQVITTNAR